MDIAVAQKDMSQAHVGGAPGVSVSGLVWIVAGFLWERYGLETGFYGLFVGGIMIYPVSLFVCRMIGAPKAFPGNPLERLALESTFILFSGMLLAYCLLHSAPDKAFPAMAVSIGVRYLVFRTIYGNATYWILGGGLAVIGGLAALERLALPLNLALAVGLIELVLSVVVLLIGKPERTDKALRPEQKAA